MGWGFFKQRPTFFVITCIDTLLCLSLTQSSRWKPVGGVLFVSSVSRNRNLKPPSTTPLQV